MKTKYYYHIVIVSKGFQFNRIGISIAESDIEKVIEQMELEKGEKVCKFATKIGNFLYKKLPREKIEKTIGILMTPMYFIAYGLSKALRIKGYEDMETPKEWIEIIKSI